MGSIVKRADRPKPWLVRFRGSDGREVSKAFKRKVDADRWLAAQETDRDRGIWADPRSGKATFAEQAERWRDGRHGLRPTTLARDEQILKTLVLPAFADRQLSGITSEQVEKWIAGLVAKGYSPSTIHKASQILSGVLRSALRARRIAVNPAAGLSLPSIERHERSFLTADQIHAIADAIDARYRAMVLLGGFAGLRFGEVCGLRGSSFGVGMRSVTVTETVSDVRGEPVIGPPKTRASIRTVALPAFLADELPVTGKDELMFPAPEGGPIRATNWRRRYWAPAVKSAGLEGVTFHSLRHSQGALLVEQGEHPLVVARRLGHTSVRTVLDVYGHVFENIDTEAAARLDDAFRARADRTRTKTVTKLAERKLKSQKTQ